MASPSLSGGRSWAGSWSAGCPGGWVGAAPDRSVFLAATSAVAWQPPRCSASRINDTETNISGRAMVSLLSKLLGGSLGPGLPRTPELLDPLDFPAPLRDRERALGLLAPGTDTPGLPQPASDVLQEGPRGSRIGGILRWAGGKPPHPLPEEVQRQVPEFVVLAQGEGDQSGDHPRVGAAEVDAEVALLAVAPIERHRRRPLGKDRLRQLRPLRFRGHRLV